MPLRVRKAKISAEERELFERYGESVIGQVVAQIASPLQADLSAIMESKDKRLAARDWLTERGDIADWHARRDFLMEIAIIALIIGEIALALWEGNQQAAIFAKMNSSLATTASVLQALQTTQEQSLAELNKQLAILQDQDQARLESLQRKPRLLITAGGANLMNRAQKPKPCLPLPGRGDIAGCSIQIENRGDLPFTNGRLRIWSASSDAYVNGSNIEASQLSPKGILANGIEVLLPPILKGEPPRVAAVEIVIAHKHPINLNLQIVGDGVDATNLTPMQALPVMNAAN